MSDTGLNEDAYQLNEGTYQLTTEGQMPNYSHLGGLTETYLRGLPDDTVASNPLPTPIKPGPFAQAINVIEASSWHDIAFWSTIIILYGVVTGTVASAF